MTRESPAPGRREIGIGLVALGLATALRAVLAAGMDLMPQDAYYFLYAENLQLSYHDHPPAIGWLLWLAKSVFGTSELAIRVATLGTTLLTQLAVGALAWRLYPELGSRALALFAALPMVTVLSLVATPDVPLLLGWTIALLGLEAALFRDARRGWLVAGTGMGLAMLAKYTAVFLPAGLMLFLIVDEDRRSTLRKPGPWIAFGILGLFTLPVAIWNLRHGGASVAFQAEQRLGALASPDLDDLFGFLLTQGLSVLPVPLALLLARATRGLWLPRLRALDSRARFLWCFTAPLLLTSLVLSPFLWVKLNWPMPAFVGGILLLVPTLARGLAFRIHLGTAAAIHLLLAIEVLAYPVPVESNDTWWGWQRVAEAVETRHAEDSSRFVFSTDSYKTAAELRFYSDLPEVHGVNVVGCPALHLDYLDGDLSRLAGRDALLVVSEEKLKPTERTEAALRRAREFFDEVRETERIAIRHRGRTARLLRVFEADGYRGPDATRESDLRAVEDPCRFSPTS